MAVLSEARRIGLLGPGEVEPHVRHSLGFVEMLGRRPHASRGPVLDLGSGAGVPGLVIALALPDLEVLLLDGRQQRAAFLRSAVDNLGLSDRVEVVAERAEEAGRSSLRNRCAAVVARGFGPPPVTAECAAPLLAPRGCLVVSEPPSASGDRWPEDGCALVGLRLVATVTAPFAFALLEAGGPCPDRYPRRIGVPAKRPLF